MTSRYRQILLEKKTPLWQRKEGQDPEGGLSVAGSKSAGVERPVTKKPSKLKKGSKPAKRRKSFCARMGGMKKKLTSKKTASDPDSRINKALRKWNCSTDVVRGARLALAEAVISVHEISIGRLKDYLAAAKGREKKEGEGSVSARRSNFIGRAEDRIRRASEPGSKQQKKTRGEHGNTGSVRNVAAAGGGENFQTGTKIAPGEIPQGRISPEKEKALGDAADRTQGKPVKVNPYTRSSSTASLDALDAGPGKTRNLPSEERRKRADAANLAIRKSSTPQRRARGERALKAFRERPVVDPDNS